MKLLKNLFGWSIALVASTLMALSVSCGSDESPCDINPPMWIQGEWEFPNGKTIEFVEYDIFSDRLGVDGLCGRIVGEIAAGHTSFFDEIEITDSTYYFRYLSSNRPPRPVEYWVRSGPNEILKCEESDCIDFVTLKKK